MKKTRNFTYILLFLTFLSETGLQAQIENFIVKRTSFSSRITDEFSPVYYNDGLVFCSNRGDNSIIGYSDNQKGLYKIVFVKKTNTGWKQPGLFANELTTLFNDGPVSFNTTGNRAYFSRNNRVNNILGNVSDTTNKLGLYSAELIAEKWTHISPFAFTDPEYNFSTPSLSPDEMRIYFSSDMPGGFGGMDLYYSEKQDGNWKEPVNMGPFINTNRSESFPFAARDGKLFFSSDGHPGFGGKDIYYTQQIKGKWIMPVHLDAAINSIADDFGLITDSTFEQGFFSSNRFKTDDIFSFNIFQPQFAQCDTIQENNYCFTFYDERQQLADTIPVIYNWDFGDGKIRNGKEVKYCFPGIGEYTVRLTIMDAIEGKTIADKVEYKVNLKDIEQALINSDNIGLVNQPMSFQGITSSITGFEPSAYFWNFGDGFRPGGPLETRIFGKRGEYTVHFGLWGQKDSLGIIPEKCYLKNVRIFDSYEELVLNGKKEEPLRVRVFLMDDLSENQKVIIKNILATAGNLEISQQHKQLFESDSPLLEKITEVLISDPGIILETSASPELSRQMAFYFRNKALNGNSFYCNSHPFRMSSFDSAFTQNKSSEMIVEFIFMKNNTHFDD